MIARDLDQMTELLDTLEPLAELGNGNTSV